MSTIVEARPVAQVEGAPVQVAPPDLGGLGEILDRLTVVMDELVGFDSTGLSNAALELGIQRYVEQERRSPAGRNALVFEAMMRVLPQARRHRSTGTYLRELLRCSAAEGNAWARQAEELQPRPAISGGDPLPPRLPETARAVTDGAICDRHVGLLMATMRNLPTDVGSEERADWEALLARQARTLDPDGLDLACKHVLAVVDPDGKEGSREHERARKRDFTIGRQGLDGMTPVRGLLTPTAAAMLRSALDPLAAPQSTKDCPDIRLAGQRNHDALQELSRRALASGDLPVRHGHHATMLVIIRLEDLEARTGLASVAHGGHIPVSELLHHAADTGVVPIVLDSDAVVMHYGEEQRFGDEHQRRALIAMDIGCTWPGCSMPGVFCECAHCVAFRISKKTSIDDLALMCCYHHHYADAHDWQITRRKGRVWVIPPTWVDPQQVPRTNEFFKPLRT